MSPTILGRISSQTFPQTATGSRLFLAQREVVRIGSGAGAVSGTNFALLVARFRTLFLGTQILGTQILGIRSHFHYRSRMERRLQPRRYGRGATNRGHGFGRAYMDSATETPVNGDIEVWQIANLTGDTHPIHFHLVNVQIISRQPFKVSNYNGTPTYTEPARPPDPNEAGWKIPSG